MSMGSPFTVFDDIRDEHIRQRELKEAGRFPYLITDHEMSDLTRLAILTEELGEVARAIQDEPDNLRAELVQLAACCVAYVQWLDRSDPK